MRHLQLKTRPISSVTDDQGPKLFGATKSFISPNIEVVPKMEESSPI